MRKVKAAHGPRRASRLGGWGVAGVLAAVPLVVGLGVVMLALIVLPLSCEPFGENRPASRSTVIGVDRRNGRTRWSFATEGSGELAASNISRGWLAVRSRDGDLIVLSARTGERRWDAQLDDVAASRPVIEGTTVMILTSDRTVHAYDVRSGHVRWAVRHAVGGHPAQRRGPDLPSDLDVRDSFGIAASHGVLVTLGRDDRNAHAYSVAQGTLRWTAALDRPAGGIPVIANDLVLVQDRAIVLHALDLKLGTTRWVYDASPGAVARCERQLQRLIDRASRTTSTPSATALSPLGDFCASSGGRFRASTDLPPSIGAGDVVVDFDPVEGVTVLDRFTGAPLWTAGFRFVAPAPHAGALIGSAGSTSWRDARTGAVRWQLPYRSELVVSGGEVVLATRHRLVGVAVDRGTVRWSRRFSGPQSTPFGAAGNIVVLSQ